ncbi:hypothetical protein PMIN06_012597 [Paraphaeosphaeria minitans]|uniref:Uncharacterized protein n=1 Tax=Paraphaeosphaeria minitans TaxID=565426 RepID=A0A9P6KK50_9PLEO|nr:hypothetical protein PMIN01_12789 [Paraphaeosphaeria minitans]
MPLPSPWKTPSAPTSPPSLRRKTSLRHRHKARLGLLVLIAVLAVCALNELRCMHYGCVSRLSFHGAGVDRAGGATLPEDWKYRLGEQLKANMQEQAQMEAPPPLDDGRQRETKDGNEGEEEKENGALIEPLTISPTIDPSVYHAGDKDRWIDSPPGPAAPDKAMQEQMQAGKQTYVDGEGIEAPPAKPAKPHEPPAEASQHLAAEDLKTAAKTPTSVLPHAAEKKDEFELSTLDGTGEKVDSSFVQETVPTATFSPFAASQLAPSPSPESTQQAPDAHTKALSQSQSQSQPQTHHALGADADADTFGSMEMGLLMGGR